MNERFIVIGGSVIIVAGFLNAVLNQQPISRAVFGGVLFVAVLSIIALFGGVAAQVAKALVALALLVVLINEVPQIVSGINVVTAPATVPTAQGTSGGPPVQ